jgi:hypothetical protein
MKLNELVDLLENRMSSSNDDIVAIIEGGFICVGYGGEYKVPIPELGNSKILEPFYEKYPGNKIREMETFNGYVVLTVDIPHNYKDSSFDYSFVVMDKDGYVSKPLNEWSDVQKETGYC